MTTREKYSHAIADTAKEQRRKDADARLEARKQRGDKGQLAKLDAEGWNANKERARINNQPAEVDNG